MTRNLLIALLFASGAHGQDLSCRFAIECVDGACGETEYGLDVTFGEDGALALSDVAGDGGGRAVGPFGDGGGIIATGTGPVGPFVAALPDPGTGGAASLIVAAGPIHIAYQGECE